MTHHLPAHNFFTSQHGGHRIQYVTSPPYSVALRSKWDDVYKTVLETMIISHTFSHVQGILTVSKILQKVEFEAVLLSGFECGF